MKLPRKRLLARLVAKHRAARISARRAAEEGAEKQATLRYPPSAPFRLYLVDAEQHKSPQVDDDPGRDDVGGGKEGGEGHGLVYGAIGVDDLGVFRLYYVSSAQT